MGVQPGHIEQSGLLSRENLLHHQKQRIGGTPIVFKIGREEFLASPHYQPIPERPDDFKEILLVAQGNGSVHTVEDTLTLGREQATEIQIDDPNVSGQHAIIERDDNGFSLEDTSTYGTAWRFIEPVERVAKEGIRVLPHGQSEPFVLQSLSAIIDVGGQKLELLQGRDGSKYVVSENGKIFYQLKPDATGVASITIGSDEISDICLEDEHVSKHHARIQIMGRVIVIRDEGSKEGIFIKAQERSREINFRRQQIMEGIQAMDEAQKRGDKEALLRIRSALLEEPLTVQERITRLETFIQKGTQLLRKRSFEEAVDYFENVDAAHSLRFSLNLSRSAIVHSSPSPTDIEIISGSIALDSHCERVEGTQIGEIKVGRIRVDPTVSDNVRKTLYHEVALVHAEEWLHALQYLRKSSLAGVADMEADILAYYLQNNIPVTENFINRQGRHIWYEQQKKNA